MMDPKRDGNTEGIIYINEEGAELVWDAYDSSEFQIVPELYQLEKGGGICYMSQIKRWIKMKLFPTGFNILRYTLEFGDYCIIEQKRYRGDNEHYEYKVIGVQESNYSKAVPVDANNPDEKIHGETCPVVRAICCGIDERKVETFRLIDVKPKGYGR